MKKIVILHDIPQYKDRLQKIADNYEVVFTHNKTGARAQIQDAEIIMGWNSAVDELLDSANTSLKWVQHTSAGVDCLPLQKLKDKGIILTNASGVHPKQLSESLFASILALGRRIPDCVKAQEKSQWENAEISKKPFAEVHNRTIGIIGAGAIGQEVAKIARGFSMYTIGVKRTQTQVPYIDEIFTMDSFYEVLKRCDYIVNLLPLTKETKGIFNKEAFQAMETGTRFFNFGRGQSVVTEDLIEALESGKISAAAIDVADPEPLPKDSPLWKLDNVLIMPHISGISPYYFDRVMDIFTENLEDYLRHKEIVRARVDLNSGY